MLLINGLNLNYLKSDIYGGIPAAERYNLITETDHYVVRKTLK